MSDTGFKSGESVSKNEFLSQFGTESVELIIKVSYAWKKGRSFPKVGDEYLARINYKIPWEVDEVHPMGHMGTVYWFSRKKVLGYPFTPKFKEECFYRIRAKKCIYEEHGGTYLLEEVLASEINPEDDSSLYNEVVSKYLSRFAENSEELTIYSETDVSVGKEKMKLKEVTGFSSCYFIASEDGSYSADNVLEGSLCILHDKKQFRENERLVFKKGAVYRVLVKRCLEGSKARRSFLLDRVVEKDVKDDELKVLGNNITGGGDWSVEGVGDFTVKRRNGISEVWTEIVWKTVKAENGVSEKHCDINLACDAGSPLTAVRTSEILKTILSDKANWEKMIYNYMADETAGDDGTIETWEGEDDFSHITREEFVSRLCISTINIDSDGLVEVFVDLDEMFTDHCYWIDIYPDGEISSHGLAG